MKKSLFFVTLLVLLQNFCQADLTPLNFQRQTANKLNLQEAYSSSPIFKMDKLKHFTFSFYMTTTSYYIGNRMAGFNSDQARKLSASLSFGLGIGKESFDKWGQQESFSFLDLAADFAGVALALIFIDRVEND